MARMPRSRDGGVGRIDHSQCVAINVADRVGSRSHAARGPRDGVLPDAVCPSSRRPRALSSCVPWTRGGRRSHVQLLLMAKEEIPTGEAASTFGAFKGLLLRMGPFMTFQMLETRKGPTTGGADMGSWLIRLGRRPIGIRRSILPVRVGRFGVLLRRNVCKDPQLTDTAKNGRTGSEDH